MTNVGRLCLVICLFISPLGFGAPVQVAAEGTQPQLAVSASGEVHVVYGKSGVGAVFHSESSDWGKTFSAPEEIGRVPGLSLNMGRGPQIAVSGKSVLITALSHEDGKVRLWIRDVEGGKWVARDALNDAAGSAKEGLHAMAANAAGTVAVVWLDGRSGKTEIWGVVSKDGGKVWGGNRLVYKSPDGTVCECCRPSVAVRDDGRIAVMWRNWLGGSRDMYVAESSDGGVTFSAAAKLGEGTWKLKGCPMDGGGIVYGASGKPVSVWRRERAAFESGGEDETEISGKGMRPLVVSTGSDAVYFWEADGNVMIKVGVSGKPEIAEKGAAFASVARASEKKILLSWQPADQKKSGIFVKVLDLK